MTHRKAWGVASLIGLMAFAAALLFVYTITEQVPHSEDEAAYLFQAQVLAQNRLTVPTPPLADAFWSPFVLDYQGRRFGKYPVGWPLLLSVGVQLNTPWLINGLLSAVTLVMIAGLGFCFYRQEDNPIFVGLLAAGLGLTTPAVLFQSGLLLSHAASLFWGAAALASLCRLAKPNQSPRLALLTGGAVGMAFITRPFAGLSLGLVIGLFLTTLAVRRQLPATALGWSLLGGAPVAALLLLYYWAIGDSPTFNPYLLVWPYDRVGFGPDVGPHGFTLHDAIFINTRLKLTALAGGLFGWPGWANLLFLPIPFLTRRATKWEWLLLALIFSVIGVHIFYWAFGGADGGVPRYYYDALPAFLLLTARGVQLSSRWLNRRWEPLRWLPMALVGVFVMYNLGWTLPALLAVQQNKYGISAAPLRVVAQADLTEPALILVQNVESWSDFAAPFSANSPTLDGPVLFAIAWNDDVARQLRRQFPNRVCWQLIDQTLTRCDPPSTDQ